MGWSIGGSMWGRMGELEAILTSASKRLLSDTCMDHTEFSRKGGSSKSERKQAASRANIAKARLAKINRGSTLSSVKTAGSDARAEVMEQTDSVSKRVKRPSM